MQDKLNSTFAPRGGVIARPGFGEQGVAPHFVYTLTCRDKAGNVKWVEEFKNLVTTAGKNHLLDTYFEGAAYTAAFFLGLIDASGYTAVDAADTMASHAGWTEATQYDEATREALSFAAAAAGSKATDVVAAFTINATKTIKGAFVCTNNTKGGTTGTLYSAGAFAADRSLVAADVLEVTVTMTA